MDAGKLNRWVTLQRAVNTPDGSGGYIQAWRDISRIKVSATPVAGKEGLEAGTLRATQPWRIQMRFRADIETEDRMKADWLPGRKLELQSIADPGEPRPGCWLVIFATAVPA